MGVPKLATTFRNKKVNIVTQQASDNCPFPILTKQNLSLSVLGSIEVTNGGFTNIENVGEYSDGLSFEILVQLNLYDLKQKKVVPVTGTALWQGSNLGSEKVNFVEFSGDLGQALGCTVGYENGKQVWQVACASDTYGYWNAPLKQ